jgi:hypothetical protein
VGDRHAVSKKGKVLIKAQSLDGDLQVAEVFFESFKSGNCCCSWIMTFSMFFRNLFKATFSSACVHFLLHDTVSTAEGWCQGTDMMG